MTDALARYWQQRYTPNRHDPDFAADLARIAEAQAAGHTLAHSASPADGTLRISLHDALGGSVAPLVLADGKLWLYRTFHAEATLARHLLARLREPLLPEPAGLASQLDGLYPAQQQAVRHALTHTFTLINGGPGTGKTHTVARLVATLQQLAPDLRIALAAPTGKAAKRMGEALGHLLPDPAQSAAQTLHRLLGIGHDNIPRHHAGRPLPYDLILLDEASMLSLELAHHLFAALTSATRLILIGDAGQLAAVEPGAVLHDLCRHPLLAAHTVTLATSRRFAETSGIGQLARAVQAGERDTLHSLFAEHPDLEWRTPGPDSHDQLFAPYQPYISALQQSAPPDTCFDAFNRYRILCAGHHGALGTERLNHAMRHAHLRALNLATSQHWYHGKPVMITANDYANHLYNGDTGLCLESGGKLQLHFPDRPPLPLERLNPAQLQDAYAMTVHKSQGSEFAHIALALDAHSRKHLSRELLYTGITRARQTLTLYSATLDAPPPIERSTGLDILLNQLGSKQPALI